MTPTPADLIDEGLQRAHFAPVSDNVSLLAARDASSATATVSDPDAVSRGKVLMVRHPSGAATFHLPTDQGTSTLTPQLVFNVPASHLPPATEAAIPGSAPPTVLLTHDAADLLGDDFVKWYRQQELADHPHRIRQVTTDGKNFVSGDDFTDWAALDGKTVLLFVHGIFSSSQNCFHALPADLINAFTAHYPAVLCFDHPTVTVDPRDNVRWLLDRIPNDIKLDFRIIAHSRGGLVARILAGGLGAQLEIPDGIIIETIALAGTPNLGTPIVSIEKWGALVNRLANLAALLPAPFHDAGEFIANVLQLLKACAADTADQLPGLTFMLNGQATGVLADLDQALSTTNTYYAIDTDFQPSEELWHIFDLHRDEENAAETLVKDPIFEDKPNDIAVPTGGVRGTGLTGGGFPITEGLSFGQSDTVWHCSYFDNPKTTVYLGTWLLDDGITTTG